MATDTKRYLKRHRHLVLEVTVLLSAVLALGFAAVAELDSMSGNRGTTIKAAVSNPVVVAGTESGIDNAATGTIRPLVHTAGPSRSAGLYRGP